MLRSIERDLRSRIDEWSQQMNTTASKVDVTIEWAEERLGSATATYECDGIPFHAEYNYRISRVAHGWEDRRTLRVYLDGASGPISSLAQLGEALVERERSARWRSAREWRDRLPPNRLP
jgi:hypothetical protein